MAVVELASTNLFSDPSLRAYWKLENVNDSKNSYNLTNTNSVTFTTAKFNNGANFGATNTNKRLDISSTLGLTSGGSLTISLWAKLLTEIGAGTYQFIQLSRSTGAGNDDYEHRIEYEYNSGTRRIGFRRFSNALKDVFYNIALGTTDWNNFVYVFTAGVGIEGFVNGASIGMISDTSTTYTNNQGDNVRLGNYGTAFNFLSGMLDDIAIFDRALSREEVNYIYTGNAPSSGSPIFFGNTAIA